MHQSAAQHENLSLRANKFISKVQKHPTVATGLDSNTKHSLSEYLTKYASPVSNVAW